MIHEVKVIGAATTGARGSHSSDQQLTPRRRRAARVKSGSSAAPAALEVTPVQTGRAARPDETAPGTRSVFSAPKLGYPHRGYWAFGHWFGYLREFVSWHQKYGWFPEAEGPPLRDIDGAPLRKYWLGFVRLGEGFGWLMADSAVGAVRCAAVGPAVVIDLIKNFVCRPIYQGWYGHRPNWGSSMVVTQRALGIDERGQI